MRLLAIPDSLILASFSSRRQRPIFHRLSAEPVHRDERARLMAEVSRNGYIANYGGIRISKNGIRFRIENAIVWNLLDSAGELCGQAAMFEHWHFLA